MVDFPNGSLGRSFAQVGAAKPTTLATTGDLLLLCLMALGLALCAIAVGIRAAIRRLS